MLSHFDKEILRESYLKMTGVPGDIDPTTKLIKESLELSIQLLQQDIKDIGKDITELKIKMAITNTKIVLFGGGAGAFIALIPFLWSILKSTIGK